MNCWGIFLPISVSANNISNINQSLENKLRTKGNKKKAVEPTIAYLPFNKIGCEALWDKSSHSKLSPKESRLQIKTDSSLFFNSTCKSLF
jgi:hypothetical protein